MALNAPIWGFGGSFDGCLVSAIPFSLVWCFEWVGLDEFEYKQIASDYDVGGLFQGEVGPGSRHEAHKVVSHDPKQSETAKLAQKRQNFEKSEIFGFTRNRRFPERIRRRGGRIPPRRGTGASLACYCPRKLEKTAQKCSTPNRSIFRSKPKN